MQSSLDGPLNEEPRRNVKLLQLWLKSRMSRRSISFYYFP